MTFAEAGLLDGAPLPPPPHARPDALPRASGAHTRSSDTSPGDTSPLDTGFVVVPPVAVPAPESVPSEPPEGPAIDPLLLRFAAEARRRTWRSRPSGAWP